MPLVHTAGDSIRICSKTKGLGGRVFDTLREVSEAEYVDDIYQAYW